MNAKHTSDYVGAKVNIPDYPSRTIQGQAGYRTVPWDDWVGMRQRALDLAALNEELVYALEQMLVNKAEDAGNGYVEITIPEQSVNEAYAILAKAHP